LTDFLPVNAPTAHEKKEDIRDTPGAAGQFAPPQKIWLR